MCCPSLRKMPCLVGNRCPTAGYSTTSAGLSQAVSPGSGEHFRPARSPLLGTPGRGVGGEGFWKAGSHPQPLSPEYEGEGRKDRALAPAACSLVSSCHENAPG